VFAEEVEGLLALGAQNVRVDVHTYGVGTTRGAGPHVAAVRVHHDWPGERLPDGARLELGDLDAREPKSMLVEWLVAADDDAPADAGPPAAAFAELVVHAHAVSAGGGVERVTLTLPVAVGGVAGVEPAIEREVLLLEAARARCWW